MIVMIIKCSYNNKYNYGIFIKQIEINRNFSAKTKTHFFDITKRNISAIDNT